MSGPGFLVRTGLCCGSLTRTQPELLRIRSPPQAPFSSSAQLAFLRHDHLVSSDHLLAFVPSSPHTHLRLFVSSRLLSLITCLELEFQAQLLVKPRLMAQPSSSASSYVSGARRHSLPSHQLSPPVPQHAVLPRYEPYRFDGSSSSSSAGAGAGIADAGSAAMSRPSSSARLDHPFHDYRQQRPESSSSSSSFSASQAQHHHFHGYAHYPLPPPSAQPLSTAGSSGGGAQHRRAVSYAGTPSAGEQYHGFVAPHETVSAQEAAPSYGREHGPPLQTYPLPVRALSLASEQAIADGLLQPIHQSLSGGRGAIPSISTGMTASASSSSAYAGVPSGGAYPSPVSHSAAPSRSPSATHFAAPLPPQHAYAHHQPTFAAHDSYASAFHSPVSPDSAGGATGLSAMAPSASHSPNSYAAFMRMHAQQAQAAAATAAAAAASASASASHAAGSGASAYATPALTPDEQQQQQRTGRQVFVNSSSSSYGGAGGASFAEQYHSAQHQPYGQTNDYAVPPSSSAHTPHAAVASAYHSHATHWPPPAISRTAASPERHYASRYDGYDAMPSGRMPIPIAGAPAPPPPGSTARTPSLYAQSGMPAVLQGESRRGSSATEDHVAFIAAANAAAGEAATADVDELTEDASPLLQPSANLKQSTASDENALRFDNDEEHSSGHLDDELAEDVEGEADERDEGNDDDDDDYVDYHPRASAGTSTRARRSSAQGRLAASTSSSASRATGLSMAAGKASKPRRRRREDDTKRFVSLLLCRIRISQQLIARAVLPL